MKRLILAVAVTGVLVMSMAAPAVAAPTQNPRAFVVTITCGGETFHDTTTGKVGFLEDWPGTAGMAFGGTYHLYTKGVDGVANTADDVLLLTLQAAPPPGLLELGKLEACTSFVDWGDEYSVWDPLYIMRTPNSPI